MYIGALYLFSKVFYVVRKLVDVLTLTVYCILEEITLQNLQKNLRLKTYCRFDEKYIH
jgi:hypothetical protein